MTAAPTTTMATVGNATTVKFPSPEAFENGAAAAGTYDEIFKWTSLPLRETFHIQAVTEIMCRSGGGGGADRVSKFARLAGEGGAVTTVWLPGTVVRELATFPAEDVAGGHLFIRSLGPKVSQTTGHTYHNFKIVKE